MTLDEALQTKKVLICCGGGGVGKTTTAAALALEGARRGKRSIVLTIDPAKRLATALGLGRLTDTPRRVGGDELYAMMLDTKRTFDRVIERYAPSENTRRLILENRLYQHLSNMMAGSQEYMAMERLFEVHQEGKYDLMVLDTPPTRQALDFLEAPQKMIRLTSNSLINWFLKKGLFASRKVLSVFDRLAGFRFLHELSEMISLLGGLLGGFHDRAEAVYQLLRDPSVGFLLVTSTSPTSIEDASYFLSRIQEGGLPFLGFVVNRVIEREDPPLKRRLDSLPPDLRRRLNQTRDEYQELALRDEDQIKKLKEKGGKVPFYLKVPQFADDIHHLKGLTQMNRFLFKNQELR